MTTSRAPLNSEQALDAYFLALMEDELAVAAEPEFVSGDPELQRIEQLAVVSAASKPYAELQSDKQIELQRLLSQVAPEEATVPVVQADAVTTVPTQIATETVTQIDAKSVEQLDDAWREVLAEETAHDAAMLVQPVEPETRGTEVHSVESRTVSELAIVPQAEVASGASPEHQPTSWHNIDMDSDLQVLFFLVNSVTFAVPLNELGGIHRLAETNTLIGRPSWYLGLQTLREQQLDVVDTARWVMPDKITDDEYRSVYQYIVMLGDSQWGLASDNLVGTETLVKDQIRWRESKGKRPWLAGMVKEKMCALIHVKAMINMLNAGLDVNGVT